MDSSLLSLTSASRLSDHSMDGLFEMVESSDNGPRSSWNESLDPTSELPESLSIELDFGSS